MSPLLAVDAIRTCYGKSEVLHGVSLEIKRGEVVSLIGRNGMGKTTTVRSIMGLTPPSSGAIHFDGEPILGTAPNRIAAGGLALVPEGRQIFPNLTVRENLTGFARKGRAGRDPWTLARVFSFFPRLEERSRNMGNQLSGGEQQMLAIGRALMTNSELILIDEATEGLAPLVREEIWRCLRALKAAGLALLVIDKYVDRLVDVCDRHYIIEGGVIAWSGTSAELGSDRALWHRYLGV